MHNHYKDILDRIPEPPSWFDDRGVPRYEPFAPTDLANIYAREAALAEISCQQCGRLFHVAMTEAYAGGGFSLGDSIRLGCVGYGDPPNVRCCDAGPTMTSEMRSVLEYWAKDYEVGFDWRRDPKLEGPFSEIQLDPPDTIGDMQSTLKAGARKILTVCTSHMNRADLACRMAAVMAVTADRRVSVIYPEHSGGIARKSLAQYLPDAQIGSVTDNRRVVLASFVEAKRLRPGKNDVVVIMSGPPSKITNPDPPPHVVALEEVWKATSHRFSNGPDGCIRIELALPHSRTLLVHPDVVIDSGILSRSGL